MTLKSYIAGAVGAFALTACGGASDGPGIEDAPTPPTQAETSDIHPALADVAAGTYSLENNHAFMTVTVGHNGGISQYRISFTEFDGFLSFNPTSPESSSLTFAINPMAVETNYPGDYKAGHPDSAWENWNEDISRDAKWLNADEFPEITFVTTAIERTGADTGIVTGDLTLLGVTKPVSLDVSYGGVANPPWFGERDVLGFTANTTVKRSEFGMAAYIPNISDEVAVSFSGEFLQDE
ncbi:MAG: YceI family protein [Pseudomonadota bacterium]